MRFEVNLPDDLIKQLDGMSNLDTFAPEMLKRSAPYMKDAIQKAASVHDDTGAMSHSVKSGKVKRNKYGGYEMQVIFSGYDKTQKPTPNYPNGVPNVVKAAGIEYGNAHEPARPFLQSAANACADDVLDAMQRAYNDEVNK